MKFLILVIIVLVSRLAFADVLNCRDQIKSLTCLVEPSKNNETRPCLPGSENYAQYFEKVYDHYPPALQKMFCSLDVIYIEKQFFGTAYVDVYSVPEKIIMGIRQSVLDESLSLQNWSSWKEQLSFGGQTDSYDFTPDLPSIETSSNPNINDFLYFVIAHEFGHLLDSANQVNKFTGDCLDQQDCEADKNSWSEFSWSNLRKPKSQYDFFNREKLCFYLCEEGVIPTSDIQGLYQDLFEKSNFISTYAATNPWDDFAESLAYFIMDRYLDTEYILKTNQDVYYDVIAILNSPRFSSKRRYLESFLDRADLKYP